MSSQEARLFTAGAVIQYFVVLSFLQTTTTSLFGRRNEIVNVGNEYCDGREPLNASYNLQKEEEETTRHADIVNALLNITSQLALLKYRNFYS